MMVILKMAVSPRLGALQLDKPKRHPNRFCRSDRTPPVGLLDPHPN